MARKKTVTLKLSKEDYDLLIPDLDLKLELLRAVVGCTEKSEATEEGREKKEAEEMEKRKEEQKKKNLENLTDKEREWLERCLEGEESFYYFRDNFLDLLNRLDFCLNAIRMLKTIASEEDIGLLGADIEVFQSVTKSLEKHLSIHKEIWNEDIENDWGCLNNSRNN